MQFHSKVGALVVAAGVVAAATAGCDLTNQKGVTGPAGYTVVIEDRHGFNPPALTVPSGSTVTFGWNGVNSLQHNVVFTDTAVSSPTQVFGTFQVTFPNARTYHYMCTVHGETGVITAQ